MATRLHNPEFLYETVQLGVLAQNPGMYCNWPTFQREFRWPKSYQGALIDSVLKGYPIPAPLVYKAVDDTGTQRFYVIDGKQRLSTLVAFMRNEFKTTGLNVYGEAPDEPRKFYRQLTGNAQNRISSYTLRLQVWINYDPELHDKVFRRMTNTIPLTLAERVRTYESEANARAERLAEHPWLQAHIRQGQLERSLDHYFALLLLAMHGPERYVRADSATVEVLARGSMSTSNHGVTATIDLGAADKAAIATLDSFARLAQSVGYINVYDLVGLVQGAQLLREQGFNLDRLPPDVLGLWLPMVRERVNREQPFTTKDGRQGAWSRITGTGNQELFVQRYGHTLIEAINGAMRGGSRAAAR